MIVRPRCLLWTILLLCFLWFILIFTYLNLDEVDPALAGFLELSDWLQGQGAYVHHCLQARNCPPHGGRCIKASCPIKAGELLISIPGYLQIQPADMQEVCPNLAEEMQKVEDLHFKEQDVLLLLNLFKERREGDEGKFGRYFRTLPTDFTSMLWDEEEQTRCLANTPAAPRVPRRFVRDRAEEKLLRSCFEDLAREEFRWGKFTTATRAFSGKDSSGKWQALVPYADVFNDAVSPTATWQRNASTGSFEVTALVDSPQGQEVMISYGLKDNEKLLTRYGYIHNDSPHDAVTIYLKDANAASGPPPAITLSLGLDEPNALRAAVRPLSSLRHFLDHESPAEREKIVMTTVKERCQAAAELWGQEAAVSPGNEWLCSGYRSGINSIAQGCATFADMALEELAGRQNARPLSGASGKLAQGLLGAWRELYAKETQKSS